MKPEVRPPGSKDPIRGYRSAPPKGRAGGRDPGEGIVPSAGITGLCLPLPTPLPSERPFIPTATGRIKERLWKVIFFPKPEKVQAQSTNIQLII